MEIHKCRIDWVDIKGNRRNAVAWFNQLKYLVKELLKDEDVVMITILNSIEEVVFEVTDGEVVIDKFDIMNKLEE